MSSQISIFDGQNPLKIKKTIRLIELFAGIGAQAKALERLGVEFEHYRVCEFDKYAVTSYNAIHGTNFDPTDIMSWNGSDLGVVDTDLFTYILTYSFPCQDLSVCGKKAGMGEGSGTRSALLWEVKRLLTETKNLPQILVMENVPAVIGKKNIDSFMQWVKFLDGLGYKSKWSIMNARDYEVPQNRERCFMVSWLGDYYYDFPTHKPLAKVLRDILIPEDEVEERYYLSEKGVNYVLRRAGKYTQILDEESQIEQSAITAKGNANWTGNFITTEPILVGGYGVKKSNGGTQWFQQDRVYSADAVAMAHPASISCGSYAYFVGGKSPLRRLTPLECWRLMDFEDSDFERAKRSLNETFYKGNEKSSSHLYQQAGNSIVVNCLVEIFRKML
jgi:DNA (cytosine-5)-methyltransferase 1